VTERTGGTELTCSDVDELAGAYVLGALDTDTDAAVRAHLETHGAAHPEIADLGSVLPVLDASAPIVEPPVELRARIMAAAAAEVAARHAVSAPVERPPSGQAPLAFPSENERTARQNRAGVGTWLVRIAAVVAIVGLVGWNLVLQNQLSAAKTYEQTVAAVMDAAAQPGSLTAVLTGVDPATGAGVAAVTADGIVTLAMQDLAPTTGQSVYEAWVIAGDGTPVALGGFTVGSSGTAAFQATGLPTEDGIVLALTLEPAPGATVAAGPLVSKGVATTPG
jgi:anti-sigma-K factor RskA